MATDTIQVGDHRYIDGRPITITREAYQGCWQYVDGHVEIHEIHEIKLSAFLPLTGDKR